LDASGRRGVATEDSTGFCGAQESFIKPKISPADYTATSITV
jgi:hypothetical protein